MFCCSGDLGMLRRFSRFRKGGGKAEQESSSTTEAADQPDDDQKQLHQDAPPPPSTTTTATTTTAAGSNASKKYAFEDGYTYPNLFQEADELLVVALLMYTFTDLRKLARQGKLGANPAILNLPITLETALNNVEENLEAIQAEEAGHEMALAALQSIQDRYDTATDNTAAETQQQKQQQDHSSSAAASPASWFNPFKLARTNHKNTEPATVTAFGDENADKELVYAVGIDHVRKRITVAFRGSVTPSDFITDACIEFHRRDNPLKDCETIMDYCGSEKEQGQPSTIGIHHGFDEYLLKRRRAGAGECKYDEIVQHVEKLFKGRTETYKLYVTGHSLGGALASLFAFEVAAASTIAASAAAAANSNTAVKIPTPVTCISVASPRVGDINFQTAFTALEQAGKLRHLRMAHAQDPVTMMPKTSSRKTLAMMSPIMFVTLAVKDALFTSAETYRHTGVKLRLLNSNNENKVCDLSYKGVTTVPEEIADDDAGKKDSKAGGLWSSLNKTRLSFGGIPGVSFHFGTTYSEQLAKCHKELSGTSLNAIYAEMGT